MTRWALVPLIGATSLAALVIGFHSLWLDEARGVWLLAKLAGSGVTLAGNFTALTYLRARSGVGAAGTLALLTGMVFIALGTASLVWTAHLAVTTGDLEAGIGLINGLISLQGALLIWDVHHRVRMRRPATAGG